MHEFKASPKVSIIISAICRNGTQLLNGVWVAIGILRMVKLFGWESQIQRRIFEKREHELTWLWKFKVMEVINLNMK